MKKIVRIGMILVAILFFIPIAYTFANSFMEYAQIQHEGVHFIPERFNLEQYYTLITDKASYFQFFLNSVRLTGIIIIGQIFIGILAAFGLSKLPSKISNIILLFYIFVLLLPFQVTLIPNYIIFEQFERLTKLPVINTYWAIILPGIFSSFGVFLLKQFIRDIPKEYLEAAEIDGATDWKLLFNVIIPILRPAIVSLAILVFIDNWNLIEQALVFIKDMDKMPLSVFLEVVYKYDYKVFYGGSVLYMIPTIIIYIKGEKYLKQGLMAGGTK